jgi:hypothetical protein
MIDTFLYDFHVSVCIEVKTKKKNKESDWTRQHPLCVYQWREFK